MSREKQIEEMAKEICHGCANGEECKHCLCGDWYNAEMLYEAGYRKQSEGEWLSVDGDVIFKCSICEGEISTSWDYDPDEMWSYCPRCGAKMKGGAE